MGRTRQPQSRSWLIKLLHEALKILRNPDADDGIAIRSGDHWQRRRVEPLGMDVCKPGTASSGGREKAILAKNFYLAEGA